MPRLSKKRGAATPGVSTPGAIVAALAIFAAATLAGCGQRGPLYMPVVPPLPPKPNFETQPPDDTVKPTPETASAASAAEAASATGSDTIPDTSGAPLSLSPDPELGTTPAAPDAPQPASGAAPNP